MGARGAGAGERGLKASQALQRPTRAYTPPPVPAEKSSSYPRLHRSAFLFQSADRLAAPPFSGQACCLERAPLLHLLARLLAPLPGPAKRRWAGGGFAREPAGFPLPLLPPRCLLLLSCVFPTLPCRHWCVSECMRGFLSFFFFFLLLFAFATLEPKQGGGERTGGEGCYQKKKKKGKQEKLLGLQHIGKPGECPASSVLGAPRGPSGF